MARFAKSLLNQTTIIETIQEIFHGIFIALNSTVISCKCILRQGFSSGFRLILSWEFLSSFFSTKKQALPNLSILKLMIIHFKCRNLLYEKEMAAKILFLCFHSCCLEELIIEYSTGWYAAEYEIKYVHRNYRNYDFMLHFVY